MQVDPLHSWIPNYQHPLLISGPCSAETEEQVMQTACALAKLPGINIYRAGIWKPRTRPGQFEGVGKQGLTWLKKAKEETGLLVAVEIATPQHVEACIREGIDIIWIGARTTGNPFSIQEIGEALKGTDIPVMIKNPVSPDVKIWVGAIERISKTGITKLAAIHRGFYAYESSAYRNTPLWEIPIELKRIIPALPVICDPSHIAGNRELIWEVSQKALDLEMNGLMIESHYAPETALTDKDQQLLPGEVEKGIQQLIIRDKAVPEGPERDLLALRTEIDSIDEEILVLLAKRMKLVKKIADHKKKNDITILQLERWSEVIYDRIKIGTRHGLDKEFILDLLHLIHEETIELQSKIINK